jgi:hypothetical protein
MDHQEFAQLVGNYGNLVGALAVVVTLAYLGIQIRQSNQAASRDSYMHWMSELNQVLLEPQQSTQFMELFQRANRDWASLSLRDQGVMSATYSRILVTCEKTFMLRERGHIDKELTTLLDTTIFTFIQIPGVATWWSMMKPLYDPAFVGHIEAVLGSADCPPPLHHTAPWYVGEDEVQSDTGKEANP